MKRSIPSQKSLITNCEQEPIHIPGLIQPFGVLMCLSEPDLCIEQVSENAELHFGLSVKDLLNESFFELISEEDARKLRILFKSKRLEFRNPHKFHVRQASGSERKWIGFFHRHQEQLILELEIAEQHEASASEFYNEVANSISTIPNATSLLKVCQVAVEELQQISGYDRVMIYRFDEEWNGEVIAETRANTDIESYLGHRFPGTDIPAQARSVFLQNWIRIIPDVNYEPSPIIPALRPRTGEPVDLGRALLRSVSPIHLQYLRNMKVGGSLTCSLIHEGKLWGLIACHHGEARLISHERRTACKVIAKLVSSQLGLKAEVENQERKRALKQANRVLLDFMSREEDLAEGLINYSPNILDLVGASGAAAAIHFDRKWQLIGNTPTEEQVEGLASWLRENYPQNDLFFTDSLSRLYPPAEEFKDKASGLLAISIPKAQRNFVFWFRPEEIQYVTWAGDPGKYIERLQDGTLKIEPRASFESWKETVRGRAAHWKAVDIEAAAELRVSILSVDLERQFRREQEARARAERVAREKEDLLSTVSHDLKNPLSAIELMLQMQTRKYQGLDPKGLDPVKILNDINEAHAMIQGSVSRMQRLIYDLLVIAKIEGGRFVIDARPRSVAHFLQEIVAQLQPLARDKGIALTAELTSSECLALVDEDRILQVLSNLVGNALKFTPEGGKVCVSVESCADEITICVSDSGPGIRPEHLPNIFDRFWQANAGNKLGTGLGLAISRGIVQAHHGKIWVESKLGRGTKVFFTIPAFSKDQRLRA